ncbi:hypothetical protein [Paeniglutamicibacter cryotolerans]|uniref:Uncharacterized protein n=1 Tax=Paeniglutamicibacter cryotolerans TaxID=670079 RepID=A0A839QKR8_9MICC|nr:hypothetical protein [Paeniglutamicibacter cryotolerans]MBB2996998.1 hypothetical protein [Paeniglutamicibacter cryotolerans]
MGMGPAGEKTLAWHGTRVGLLLCLICILIQTLPLGLFVLGGGGNADDFIQDMLGILTVGLVAILAGVLLLVPGSIPPYRTPLRAPGRHVPDAEAGPRESRSRGNWASIGL